MKYRYILVIFIITILSTNYQAWGDTNTSTVSFTPITNMELIKNNAIQSNFDRDKASEAIEYRRAWDGGYTNELADPWITYSAFSLLSEFGLTSSEISNFDKYVLDRYNSQLAYGFSTIPGDAYSPTDASFLMAIMYIELGHSLSNDIYNNLVTEAVNILEQGEPLGYALKAALFLNRTSNVNSVDTSKIIYKYSNSQNMDPSSNYYGGLSNGYDYYDIFGVYNTLKILELLNIDISTVFDLSALDIFMKKLRDMSINTVSNNYMNLNYNETYASTTEYQDIYYDDYNGYRWTFNFHAYSIRSKINNYISTDFNSTDAANLLIYHTFNTYWQDENADSIIDYEPWNRYFPLDLDGWTLFTFDDAISKLDIISEINSTQILRQLKSRFLVEGGLSILPSDMYATNNAISALYHLDRKNLSYVNNIPDGAYGDGIEKTLRFLMNLNYTNVNLYFVNGTIYTGTWFIRDINSRMGYVEAENYLSPDANLVYVLDVFDKLGRMLDLDIFYSNIVNCVIAISESVLSNWNIYNTLDAYNLIQSAALLGIDEHLDYNRIKTFVQNLQMQSGGFISTPDWRDSFNIARTFISVDSMFNLTRYLELIKNSLINDSYVQGLSYNYNYNDWIDYDTTAKMILFLNKVGVLQNWINDGTLDYNKLLHISSIAYDYMDYQRIIPWIDWLDIYISAFSSLGVNFNSPPEGFDLNITEIVRYVSDLQILDSSSNAYGAFGSNIDNYGNIDYNNYNLLEDTYYALDILNKTNQLDKINQTATVNFLQSMIINNTNSEYYQMFRNDIDFEDPSIHNTMYGYLSLKILGVSVSYDLENKLKPEYYWSGTIEKDIYNLYSLQEKLLALDNLGYSVSSNIDIGVLNTTLIHHITREGFITTDNEYIFDTYYAAKVMKNLDAYDMIDTENMWSYIADMQVLYDNYSYNYGGFSASYSYGWVDGLSTTQQALYVLFRDNQLSRINSEAAINYVNNKFKEVELAPNYLSLSMNGYIAPAVDIFDSLSDVMLPTVIAPKHVFLGQDVNIDITISDIWQEPITGVSIVSTINGTNINGVSELGNGRYSVSLQTSGMNTGKYHIIINFSKSDKVDTSVEFDIEIRPVSILPDVYFANPLMKGYDLEISIDLKDSMNTKVVPTSISIDFSGSIITPILNSGNGRYEATLSTSQYDLGSYQFTLSISANGYDDYVNTFYFEIQDISIQWNTQSSLSNLDMNTDWTATGYIVDNNYTRRDDVTFDSNIIDPNGITTEDKVVATSEGNGVWNLRLHQEDTIEGKYTIELIISLENAGSFITIYFDFTRENNLQTLSQSETPELNLLPGFELYLSIISVLFVVIINRKKK